MHPAMNETEKLCPGPVPEDETVTVEKPAFVSACMSIASSDAAALGWRLGKSILTHSDVWGFVWRIDFRTKDHAQDPEFANRLVCWGSEDGTALGTATYFGQRLERL